MCHFPVSFFFKIVKSQDCMAKSCWNTAFLWEKVAVNGLFGYKHYFEMCRVQFLFQSLGQFIWIWNPRMKSCNHTLNNNPLLMYLNFWRINFVIRATFNSIPHNHNFKRPHLIMKPFENIVRKGENTGDQHFLLFPQCFLPFQKQISNFSVSFILSSANAFTLDQSKILMFW